MATSTQPLASSPQPRFAPGQTLLFDADDTLWENNILFEEAIAGFVRLVNHATLSPAEVRSYFNHMEHERVRTYGYGTRSFRLSMAACLESLAERHLNAHEHAELDRLRLTIVDAPMQLLPRVAETLKALSDRHRLVLVTKGDENEQLEKLERSGLAGFFCAAEVVPEKDRDMYHALRSRHRLEATTTWMLGNSPKSDINPALAAGLHAVFLPHANTWVLEHETLAEAPAGQHCLVVKQFAQLAELF